MTSGSFVHSLDTRDDPETYYVVLEADVSTVSGLVHKIAPPEAPESFVYRLVRLLVSADDEIAGIVANAEGLRDVI